MSINFTAHASALGRRFALSMTRIDWRQYIVYIGFVLLFVIFAVILYPKGFLSSYNLLNILRQTAPISIMAVAMTYVLSSAEIDLSIGSVAGLASCTTAMAIAEYGVAAGVVVGPLTGIAVGVFNAILTTGAGIPSFLVTLGTLGIARGTAMWITDTAPQPISSAWFNNVFGGGDLGPIPSLAIWTAIALVVGHFFFKKTPYGRRIVATGGNEPAARFSGVNTKRIKFSVLVLSGLVAGIAGMLYAGRLESGRFQWGEGDELSVIAAAVIGGTRLFGGRGTIIGAVVGSLMIGLINNALILMGLDFSQQLMVRGGIIILAVALARN